MANWVGCNFRRANKEAEEGAGRSRDPAHLLRPPRRGESSLVCTVGCQHAQSEWVSRAYWESLLCKRHLHGRARRLSKTSAPFRCPPTFRSSLIPDIGEPSITPTAPDHRVVDATFDVPRTPLGSLRIDVVGAVTGEPGGCVELASGRLSSTTSSPSSGRSGRRRLAGRRSRCAYICHQV